MVDSFSDLVGLYHRSWLVSTRNVDDFDLRHARALEPVAGTDESLALVAGREALLAFDDTAVLVRDGGLDGEVDAAVAREGHEVRHRDCLLY